MPAAQASPAVITQSKEERQILTVADLLKKYQPKMQQWLPQHLTPNRFLRIAFHTIQKTPMVLKCTPASIVAAVLEGSFMGLEFDGTLGQAYVVPYKEVATFMPGYRGIILLAMRSGEYSDIQRDVVREGDEFKIERGCSPDLIHVPNTDPDAAPDRKKLFAYAVAFHRDGTIKPTFEYMTRAEVHKARESSQAFRHNSGPWLTHEDEMWKKTGVRRLGKSLSLSVVDTRLARAAVREDLVEAGAEVEISPEVLEVAAGDLQAEQRAGGSAPGKLDKLTQDLQGAAPMTGKTAPAAAAPAPAPPAESDIDLGEPADEGGKEGGDEGELPALPTFMPHQQALFDEIMELAAGDEEKGLSMLRVASEISPGGIRKQMGSWSDLANMGDQAYVRITRKNLKDLYKKVK